MGANNFGTISNGATAKEAFAAAVSNAQYDHGHSGYTGTIAEKGSFTVITVPEGKGPVAFANELMDADDPRIEDKWGPAGCVKVKDGMWYFFGWASS